jgi:hypothetical protein
VMVWVFKRDPAIQNQQGFVDVPDALADRLVAEQKAAYQYDATLAMEPEPQPEPEPEPVAPHSKYPEDAPRNDNGEDARKATRNRAK